MCYFLTFFYTFCFFALFFLEYFVINKAMNIKRTEWRFVFIWAVIIALTTILPYTLAKPKTPEGMYFTGFISNCFDQQSYAAWMKQASEGRLLFEDKYTTENQSGMFFHPLFLVCGMLAGILGLDMVTAYHLMRIIFGAGMLGFIYLFGAFFIKEARVRKYFLVLISVAAGWGFLLPNPVVWFNKYNIMSLDMWITEASTFLILLTKPLFAFALAALLSIFLMMLKSFEKADKKLAYAAGFLGLLLALIHPYDVFTAYIVLFFYILIKRSKKEEYFLFLLFFIISVIGIVYQSALFTFDPVFKEWSKTFTPTPNPLSFLLGYGFTGIFAMLYFFTGDHKKDKTILFLVVWLIAMMIASYLPVNFQRRMLLGYQVPVVILAVKYIFEVILPAAKKHDFFGKLKPGFILAVILILCTTTNFRYIFDCFADMKANIYNYNIFTEDNEALRWLDKQTEKSGTVLASKVISLYIPACSGHKVYAGHYDQTLNYKGKTRYILDFYRLKLPDAVRQGFLRTNKIRYVYFGPFEKMLGDPGLDKYNWLEKVYFDPLNKVSIYKLKD